MDQEKKDGDARGDGALGDISHFVFGTAWSRDGDERVEGAKMPTRGGANQAQTRRPPGGDGNFSRRNYFDGRRENAGQNERGHGPVGERRPWSGERNWRGSQERQRGSVGNRGANYGGNAGGNFGDASGRFQGQNGRTWQGERQHQRPELRSHGRRPFEKRTFTPPTADFTVTFYATDAALQPVVDAIHKTCKAYEVFRIAQTFLANEEQFVAVLRKNLGAESKFYQTIFDDIPCTGRDEALRHFLKTHLDQAFSVSEEECEAPKGVFVQIARCPFTKKLIAAPNHHSYQELLREHHLLHVRNMSFERYLERLEFTKEAEDISAWIEQMKRKNVYKAKQKGAENANVAEKTDAPSESEEQTTTESFPSLTALRAHLEEHWREFIRESDSVRIAGTSIKKISDEPTRHFVEYCLQRQRRFPLETATAMRNKLRRSQLHTFRVGKRGITYVSAIARKFRSAGEVLAPELEGVLAIIRENPMILREEFGAKVGGDAGQLAESTNSLSRLIQFGYVTELEDGSLITYAQQMVSKKPEKGDGKRVANAKKIVENSDDAPMAVAPTAAEPLD